MAGKLKVDMAEITAAEHDGWKLLSHKQSTSLCDVAIFVTCSAERHSYSIRLTQYLSTPIGFTIGPLTIHARRTATGNC